MKHEVGRVAVFVNNFAVLIPAGCAVGVVIIIPVCAVAVDNAAAIIAADVVLVEAVIAKRVRIVLDGIFLVDPISAVVADYGQAICAVLAEPIAFRLIHIFDRMFRTTVRTNSRFTHCLFLHFV